MKLNIIIVFLLIFVVTLGYIFIDRSAPEDTPVTPVSSQDHPNKKLIAEEKKSHSNATKLKVSTNDKQKKEYVSSHKTDTIQHAQTDIVAPQKPKYTVEDIRQMDISEEEKDNLLTTIMAYESYQARDIDVVPPKNTGYTTEGLQGDESQELQKNTMLYESYQAKDEPVASPPRFSPDEPIVTPQKKDLDFFENGDE